MSLLYLTTDAKHCFYLGWVVQFLISVRGGVPSKVGYVASGFWGGLTLGRVVLAEPVNKLGERRPVMVLIVAALAMQFIYWFVPNVIANAVVVSLLGFFIAPFFPVGISVLTKLLPRELHVASIGMTLPSDFLPSLLTFPRIHVDLRSSWFCSISVLDWRSRLQSRCSGTSADHGGAARWHVSLVDHGTKDQTSCRVSILSRT